jgi:secretion/DNA translocation related CpaE-like protein
MNTHRPVALVEDAELLDEVLKLAAAAGCELEVVPDVASVRLRWSSAPLVLLDAAGVQHCGGLGLPRRDSVVLVCPERPPDPLYAECLGVGVEQVVVLPEAEPWLVGALADIAEAPAGAAGRVLAVLGGRGGAGASVFAVSVGVTAMNSGGSALLVDCDPLGGGLDLVLGAESEDGLRWPDLRLRAGRVGVAALHSALPGRTRGSSRLTLLSGAREGAGPEPDAVAAVLEAGRRAGETVVCDLSRSLTESAGVALDRADLAVVVVPAEVRASISAKLLVERLTARGVPTRLVVRGPAPGGLRADVVEDVVGAPVLTTMRPEPHLGAALDRGTFRPKPRSPLAVAARATLRALAAAPETRLRSAS